MTLQSFVRGELGPLGHRQSTGFGHSLSDMHVRNNPGLASPSLGPINGGEMLNESKQEPDFRRPRP
jgi:hypothetical protein